MSSVEVYGHGGSLVSPWSLASGRIARQTSHALAQIEARTAVGVAGVEAAAELHATKVSAVGFVWSSGAARSRHPQLS